MAQSTITESHCARERRKNEQVAGKRCLTGRIDTVTTVTTLLLVRHGLTEVTGDRLAGWTPDLHLDERGRAQAADLAARLAPLPLAAIVSSPLDRCRETADAIAA